MSTLWTPGGEHPVERPDPRPDPVAPPTPTDGAPRGGAGAAAADVGPSADPDEDEASYEEEEAFERQLAAMQAELADTPASVVVANHAIGLFQLAAIHLNATPPNLEEGRLAIDAMGALVETLGDRLADKEAALREALAQVRLGYVQLKAAAPPA